jgi:L-ascorbate 6-phosphate lactonase
MKSGPALIHEIDSTAVRPGSAACWWLGQQGFAVKTASAILYFDPYVSPSNGRLIAPLLAPQELTNADLIFGSHDHSDHIDRRALPGIMAASPLARLVVPRIAVASLVAEGLPEERIKALDNGQTIVVDDITITAIAAAHEGFDFNETTGYPYLGFIIESGGVIIYHAGDTCVYDGLATALKKWNITLAFLPINGRDAKRFRSGCIGNMTYQEAVDLAGAIVPQMTIPAHYDMFAHNSENPRLFADYMDAKFPSLNYKIPRHGQKLMVNSVRV